MNSVPVPIRNTIAKTILCISAIAVFGVIWSLVSHDRMLLLLSLTATAFGTLKVFPMISNARKGNYQVLECTILSDKKSALLNRHSITISLQDKTELTLAIGGRMPLRSGKQYRLYLAGQNEDAQMTSIPEYLRPARILMGFEPLTEIRPVGTENPAKES